MGGVSLKKCKCHNFTIKGRSVVSNHPVLEFAMFSTNMSVAPQAVSSSITDAIFSFSTIELIATQSGSSRAVIVGARLPGVIFVAISKSFRATLYWQRTNFWAAAYDQLLGTLGERIDLTYNTAYSGCDHVDKLLIRRVF